ncbi:DMT family transporter [Haloprofundus salinisoli]|uniref:DMT family transporter n=1 Tax=Haloprofundus salinisoli TaxID=2876193 RepID=UPI001CCF0B3C|nr:DMT family transporter [Haloprofundus salinisoli]
MSRARTIGLFLLLPLLFGAAFPAIKAGLDYVPPLLFAAGRYLLSAALLLGFAAATTDAWLPRTRSDWAAVLGAGVFFIGGTGLLYLGQQFTTSGVAAIIYSLIPILTPVVAWGLLPHERFSRRYVLGLFVGFVGVALVIRPDPSNLLGESVVGESLVLTAAASVTLGSVLVRRYRPTMSVVALTGWAMLPGALILVAFSLALGESLAAVRPTVTAFLLLLYLAVFASGVGFAVYFHLLETLGPLQVNLVSYLIPVVAVTVGWLFLDEPITALTLVGFAVIVAGFALLRGDDLAPMLRRGFGKFRERSAA